MRKVERTEEQREQKKYRSEAKAVAPTAQGLPRAGRRKAKVHSRLETRLVLNRGCRWSQAPDKLEWLQRFNARIRRPSVFVSPNAYDRRIRLSFIETHLVRFIKV